MANPSSVSISPKGIAFTGIISSIPSAASIAVEGLKGFGDSFFVDWRIYTVKRANGTTIAPFGKNDVVTAYTSSNGRLNYNSLAEYGGVPLVGDEIYLIHPLFADIPTLGRGRIANDTYVQPNDVNEHPVLVMTEKGTVDITLHMENVTQLYTVREYVDGAAFGSGRIISAKEYPTDFDAGADAIVFHHVSVPYSTLLWRTYLITLQALGLEGATRDIDYNYIFQDIL
jgi:hypothetical protein